LMPFPAQERRKNTPDTGGESHPESQLQEYLRREGIEVLEIG
jgi:hypothetical protein